VEWFGEPNPMGRILDLLPATASACQRIKIFYELNRAGGSDGAGLFHPLR